MAQHNDLGKKGEEEAVKLLINKGYKILRKNYRYLKHEVDVIAEYKNELIAVEVKTRSTAFFGTPQEFVKPAQIKSIVTAINAFIEKEDINLEVRFDIIAIIITDKKLEITHIEDAFLSF